jgi:hypothetical protein
VTIPLCLACYKPSDGKFSCPKVTKRLLLEIYINTRQQNRILRYFDSDTKLFHRRATQYLVPPCTYYPLFLWPQSAFSRKANVSQCQSVAMPYCKIVRCDIMFFQTQKKLYTQFFIFYEHYFLRGIAIRSLLKVRFFFVSMASNFILFFKKYL